MAKRYWKAYWDYGLVGTESYEEVDLCDLMSMNDKEIEDVSDLEAEEEVSYYAYQQAEENISTWAEPVE